MTACPPNRSRIAAEIQSYLSGHPDASDTIEGIAQWWLRERKTELPATVLKEVLSDLVTQGLIERREERGTARYRSHARK